MTTEKPVIAVIGGTGKLGSALARRWSKAGLQVIIGSRDAAHAAATASAISSEVGCRVDSDSNRGAAARGEIVVVTVPYAAQAETLSEIGPNVRGKIVVDTTVPLVPPKVMRVQLPAEGAAALRAQRLLGPTVVVVSAFHNVAASKLADGGGIDCDVLVFSDAKEARVSVVRLAQIAGMRALEGGVLANSTAAEALTSVLIFINKTYGVEGAGLRITGSISLPAHT
jgi:8-hydroxy-5-deazaflavin:NADPH oxidoreductase